MKYWIANDPSATVTTTQVAVLSGLARSSSVSAVTISAGSVLFTAATGRSYFVQTGHDSTSAIGSATKTGAANTIAGFLKIKMTSTTGDVDRFIYTYAVSPTG